MRSAFPNSVASNLGEKTTTKNTIDAHNISTSSSTVTVSNVCASIIRIRSVDFHRVIIVKSSSLNAPQLIVLYPLQSGKAPDLREVACIRNEGEASVGQRLGTDPTIHGI